MFLSHVKLHMAEWAVVGRGSDLQVCTSKNLTCCTKKVEERYQVAARRDIQNFIQMSSSSLKFLISRNVAAFQDLPLHSDLRLDRLAVGDSEGGSL
ncbi:Glypican-5 Secreted glypican-5 [Collichthys lucidus]|uniref:Glypican-5 Secreted glypican-5 n=1 Tax=Collichthys lucidus TaxID=240159 RepID=A0A4U5U8W6_COLLU|nr:Glypican-5 Secreted glypican-5 [Collichthys lucidus]